MAQPGSAPVLGTGGRRFESSRSDHFKKLRDSEPQLPLYVVLAAGESILLSVPSGIRQILRLATARLVV